MVAVLILALTASTAAAQEDGVTVDPRSPAGKQYALPIDQARRDATGGGPGDRRADGARPTPAFGQGVRPETAAGGSGSPAGDGAPGAAPRSGSPAEATVTGSARTAPSEQQRRHERGDIDRALVKASVGGSGASDGSLALLGGGVAVMVLGVAAGLALRRRAT